MSTSGDNLEESEGAIGGVDTSLVKETLVKETREKTLTEKGLSYQRDVKSTLLKGATRLWRRKADVLQKLVADEGDVAILRQERDALYVLKSKWDKCYDDLSQLYPEGCPIDPDIIDVEHTRLSRDVKDAIVSANNRSLPSPKAHHPTPSTAPSQELRKSHSLHTSTEGGTAVNTPLQHSVYTPQQHSVISGETPHTIPPDSSMPLAKLMRKPIVEMVKFNGDPVAYAKFKRHFKANVEQYCDNEDEKMMYLEQYTTGEANRIVTGFSHLSSRTAFNAAIKELDRRYGNVQVVANAYVEKVMSFPNVSPNDGKSLDNFAILLSECLYATQEIHGLGVLEYAGNLKAIVKKLPFKLQDKWRSVVQNITSRDEVITFKHLVDFISSEAKKDNDAIFGRAAMGQNVDTPRRTKFDNKPPMKSFATVTNKGTSFNRDTANPSENSTTVSSTHKPTCSYCNEFHYLSKCEKFSQISLQARIEHIKQKRLCFGCMKPNHKKSECRGKMSCQICNKMHPTILHSFQIEPPQPVGATNNSLVTDTNCSHTGAISNGICTLAIVPVQVKLKDKVRTIHTYAFLDPGSSACFCTDALLHELGGQGKNLKLTVNTMGETFSMNTKEVKGLQISALGSADYVDMPETYTKEEMPVRREHIPTYNDIRKWPHLADIVLPELQCGIGLLIGNNVPDVYSPLETKTGPHGSPHATKTKIGWIPWSVMRDDQESGGGHVSNRIEVSAIEEFQNLDQMVRKALDLEFPERRVDDKREFSAEDKQFLDKVADSTTFVDGHYYVDLPFKDDNTLMPNNYAMARQRLNSLKRRLLNDEKFKAEYTSNMRKLVDNLYAEEILEDASMQNFQHAWYIPHHGVYHPRKNKLRIVFDCAAQYQGVSLNNKLLQSPNLTNTLVGVLLKFREGAIGATGDIESMYHQVRVPKKHRDYLRFLWWLDGDLTKEPRIFRMCVHLFGATSSPAIAIGALQKTALESVGRYDDTVINTTLSCFYVDDCLVSLDEASRLARLIMDVTSLCHDGGFNLTKWVSSSEVVNKTLPSNDSPRERCDMGAGDLPVKERALGVVWHVRNDTIEYDISVRNMQPTRRNVLSAISSIYDPLGLISPCVLMPKLLLREMCGSSWDDILPERLLQSWQHWLGQLPSFKDMNIARCYKGKSTTEIRKRELHHFSDASEKGYGTVSYLRSVDVYGNVTCSLVMAKSRVAPLKKVTIPRLELSAACTAVKMNKLIQDELLPVNDVHYWTDSTSVLKYISNTSARFHTFVANRISTIQEASNVDQWHYVCSEENIADIASRGCFPNELLNSDWFQGPNFLQSGESSWDIHRPDLSLHADDPELRRHCNATDITPQECILDRFSDITRCKAVIAWVIIYIQKLQMWVQRRKEKKAAGINETSGQVDRELRKQQSTHSRDISQLYLLPSHYMLSEKRIVRIEQLRHHAKDMESLEKEQSLKTSSSLISLMPCLVDGVMCVGGRLDQASKLQDREKHPYIIPKKSHLARLLIEDAHKCLGHSGKNAILAHLNAKFWVVSGRQHAKEIVSKCVICRKRTARPSVQQMAELPAIRLDSCEPPFTNTGCDFFGPMTVKRGRCELKRYCLLFTCLTTRAVHLEMTDSLDTDSCINAVRRFVARRGPPKTILSDNGTNFIGSSTELRKELENFRNDHMISHMSKIGINWTFNTPTASHHGGVWERLIRSAKHVLYGLMTTQNIKVTDEGLRTLLCEVENIMNSRPLTVNPDTPEDLKALTPNDLLLCKSSYAPGVFTKDDTYAKKRWRQVQYLTDIFWSRWTKEYVQQLQQRQKWYKPQRNIMIGDIVLLVDSSPRYSWALAKVLEVHTDKHGVVRNITVKTATSVLQRPISKVCLILESETVI